MSAPSVAARSSGEQTTDSTSHPITLPSGIIAGDLLLLIFTSDENPTVTTSSTGWFKYGGTNDGANNVCGAIFYKWATGSDSCTVNTTTAQQSTHICLRIPNGGVPSGANAGGNSTNSDPGAAYTFQTDDYLVIATRHGDAQVVPSAPPTGYTNMMNKAATGVNGATTSTSEKQLTITKTTGSEDPGAWTVATEQWVCWTILIPPSITLVQTVLDNFSAALNPANWNVSASGVSVTGGQLNLSTMAGASGYTNVDWIGGTDATPGVIYGVKVVNIGNQGLTSTQFTPMSIGTATKSIWWLFNQGNVNDEYNIGAGEQGNVNWATAPSTAIYMGCGRYTDGDFIWAYSPDGTHWRRHSTLAWPNPTDMGTYGISITYGQYNAEASASTAIVDDFSKFAPAAGAVAFPKVRRGGAWVTPTAVKVRRAGTWVDVTGIKVRRGGAWVNET